MGVLPYHSKSTGPPVLTKEANFHLEVLHNDDVVHFDKVKGSPPKASSPVRAATGNQLTTRAAVRKSPPGAPEKGRSAGAQRGPTNDKRPEGHQRGPKESKKDRRPTLEQSPSETPTLSKPPSLATIMFHMSDEKFATHKTESAAEGRPVAEPPKRSALLEAIGGVKL